MTGFFIIGIGTFATMVIRLLNEYRLFPPFARPLAIDTHATEELPRLPAPQQCCIGDVPIQELYRHRRQYPWLNNIPMEVLRSHPENMLNGGSKIRAATQAALQWASQGDNRVESAIRTALTELREAAMETENLRIYIVAGVISTTGSGGALEIGFLVRRILRELGLSGTSTVTFLAVGSEGFEVSLEKHWLEAAFWREFEAVAKQAEIPRPHDLVQPSWADGLPFDYTFYFSRLTRGWNFASVEDLAQGVALWLAYTGLQPDVSAYMDGMRGRHHAQLHLVNDVTGCSTSLSFSGMAAYDLSLSAVRDYGLADFGVRVASSLIGEPAPNIGPFLSQVQLQPGVLRVRLGYQPDQSRMEKTITQLWKALLTRPLGDWHGLVSTSNLNLGRQLEETREALPAERRALTVETLTHLNRLYHQAAGQVQVLGALKLLKDLRTQTEKARQEASDQLGKLQNVDSIDAALAATLRGMNRWNQKAVAENVRKLLLGRYVDALNGLYLHEILRLFAEVVAWLDERIDETERLCATLEMVRSKFEQQRTQAAPTYEAKTARFLTRQDAARQDYDEMLQDIVTPHNVATLKSELISSVSREHDPLSLSACPYDNICERIAAIVELQQWLDGLLNVSFQTYWERAFKSRARKKQACEWLLTRAMPIGATVAKGYIGQEGVIPPNIEQVSIQVPEEVADEVEALLREINPLLPAHAVVRQPQFHKIVAVFEEAGYELRAKQHLCRIDAESARLSQEARQRLASGQWAVGLSSYVPHEPFEDWSGSDLLLLGLVAGSVEVRNDGFALRHRDFDFVTLGADRPAAEFQAANGYRPELVASLTSWLKAQAELKPLFEATRSLLPEYESSLVQLYDKATREWAQLLEPA